MKLFTAMAFSLALGLGASDADAQATPTAPRAAGFAPSAPARSPEILPDGRVTFRLKAPEAQSVSLVGDWPGAGPGSVVAMSKGDDGVWSTTIESPPPEMWVYSFKVDGVTVLDPGNVHVVRDGVRYISQLLISGPLSDNYMVHDVPHGAISLVWYPATSLHLNRRAYIYTPPGYDGAKRRYPVFYLLHGGGGDEDTWNSMGRVSEILDNLIAQGKAEPMIVVMPNGNSSQIASSDYFRLGGAAPGGPPLPSAQAKQIADISTSMVGDLIPFVDRTYRTLPDANDRAIAGLSMGGAQALYTAFNHIDRFAWVGGFSPAYPVLPGVVVESPSSPSAAGPGGMRTGQAIDPQKLLLALPQLNAGANQKLRLFYLSVGTVDTLTVANKIMKQVLRDQGINAVLKDPTGYAHEWRVWRINLQEFLPMLFRPAAGRTGAHPAPKA